MQAHSLTPASNPRRPRLSPQIAAVRPGSHLTRSELQRLVAEMLD